MANEISVSCSMTNSGLQQSPAKSSQVSQTNKRHASKVTSIPTTAAGTALDLDSVTDPAESYFENRDSDSTKYIEIGVQVAGTFYAFMRLYGGHGRQVPLGTTAPYARANTSAQDLLFTINDR